MGTPHDARLVSLRQLKAFLQGVEGAVTFSPKTKGYANRQKMYDWIATVAARFSYWRLSKQERGLVLSYIKQITSLSRVQVKRLLGRKKQEGKLRVKTGRATLFPHLVWPR